MTSSRSLFPTRLIKNINGPFVVPLPELPLDLPLEDWVALGTECPSKLENRSIDLRMAINNTDAFSVAHMVDHINPGTNGTRLLDSILAMLIVQPEHSKNNPAMAKALGSLWYNQEIIVGLLLAKGVEPTFSMLSNVALTHGNPRLVQRVLRALPSDTLSDTNVDHILGIMASAVSSTWSTGPEIVDALLAAGFPLNTPSGDERWTPLHYAVMNQNTDMVQHLIAHGAELNAEDVGEKDTSGATPLDWAITMNDVATVRVLLDAGASTERRPGRSMDLIEAAAYHGADHVLPMLIERGFAQGLDLSKALSLAHEADKNNDDPQSPRACRVMLERLHLQNTLNDNPSRPSPTRPRSRL